MAQDPISTRPVAVVTGGSQGLGLALARGLAAAGWALVIDARRSERLDAAVAGLAPQTDVAGIAGDVAAPEHRRALADAAATLGPVQALGNNASTLGATPLPRLGEIDPDVLRRLFDVNVVAPVALVQELDDQWAPHATVGKITSDAAGQAYEGWRATGSPHAALEDAGRGLARQGPGRRLRH